MVRVLADSHARSGERFFRDLTPNERRISSFETLENKRLLALLVQQIEQLPPTAKKILAMYYHEDFKLSEIAACFGLSECQIDEIRTQTVDLLKNYLLSAIDSSKSVQSVKSVVSAKIPQAKALVRFSRLAAIRVDGSKSSTKFGNRCSSIPELVDAGNCVVKLKLSQRFREPRQRIGASPGDKERN
jgi:predicted DNA-binding protein YlxM (UPF0122 family)